MHSRNLKKIQTREVSVSLVYCYVSLIPPLLEPLLLSAFDSKLTSSIVLLSSWSFSSSNLQRNAECLVFRLFTPVLHAQSGQLVSCQNILAYCGTKLFCHSMIRFADDTRLSTRHPGMWSSTGLVNEDIDMKHCIVFRYRGHYTVRILFVCFRILARLRSMIDLLILAFTMKRSWLTWDRESRRDVIDEVFVKQLWDP